MALICTLKISISIPMYLKVKYLSSILNIDFKSILFKFEYKLFFLYRYDMNLVNINYERS